MVSPVDGPGPPPGSYLPVPAGGRAVVPYTRADAEEAQAAGRGGRPRADGADAVAVPIPGGDARPEPRGNPFLERGEAFRRPLFASRPASLFLAQSFGQDAETGNRTGSAEAARRYQSVQETVDRDTARRTGSPGVDVVT
jgi:hypothetical protein